MECIGREHREDMVNVSYCVFPCIPQFCVQLWLDLYPRCAGLCITTESIIRMFFSYCIKSVTFDALHMLRTRNTSRQFQRTPKRFCDDSTDSLFDNVTTTIPPFDHSTIEPLQLFDDSSIPPFGFSTFWWFNATTTFLFDDSSTKPFYNSTNRRSNDSMIAGATRGSRSFSIVTSREHHHSWTR